MKTTNRLTYFAALAVLCVLAAGVFSAASVADGQRFHFIPNTLVLSRSVYVGNADTVTVGQVLPPNCVPGTIVLPVLGGGVTKVSIPAHSSSGCTTAVADGTYPTVFDNSNLNGTAVDGSFGVTSPIFLDDITTEGQLLDTLPIPTDQIVTSFSSKSELAVHLADDHKSITLVGYVGGPGFVTGPNQLDISNSNTPGVVDPSNPVSSQYFRAVAEVFPDGSFQVTPGNGYSGNNGRSAIKANGLYYMTGNDNNGGLSRTQLGDTQVGVNLVTSTGVELLVPGQVPPVPPNINMIGDFSVTQVGYATADKPGKDNNFRGSAIFNNTLFVTKGSGGNGINTVYQVGNTGVLPTGTTAELEATPITIVPGFSAVLASGLNQAGNPAPVAFPFGLFFANDHTLYVCDEGDGALVSPPVNGNVASAAAQATAGIQKWILNNGTWSMAYVLQDGLNIGIPYSVPNYPAAINPATDGCRNITGRSNGDGTVTIFAVTSTVSPSGDQGADPNKLVRVTDRVDANTLPTGGGLGHVTTIRSAGFGEVLRGVSFAPTDNGDSGDGQF